jgi:glycosyltransferase involved in cell wall biosynthesis
MENDFLISAVIPAYNNGKYIARAIDSVLSQSYKPMEVIVVDDGSTDNTEDVVKTFGDKIKYIRKENGGASSARNVGILAAKGDWIAFLDGDDEWLENRLEDQVSLLKKDNTLKWVSSNFITCLCLSGRRAAYTPDVNVAKLLNEQTSISYYAAAVQGISGCTDTMLIRKACLIEAGPFDINYQLAEDLDMWWRIACRWPRIGVVAAPGAVYHMQVGGSITKARFPAQLYSELIIRHRKIASEHNHLNEFDEMASFMVKRWLRSMLFHRDRTDDIRLLLRDLDCVIPRWYRYVIRLGIVSPAFTEILLRGMSRLVRTLRLRKRLVPPPDKMVR